ncbi:MAG: hypothetical protein ACTSP4_10060 [Candidatus Hodarchaeales archaeon]
MMIEAITFVAVAVIGIAIAGLAFSLKRSSSTEDKMMRVLCFLTYGTVAAVLDFAIEFKGTSASQWSYDRSLLLLGGLVPIELPVMFFSFGIIMAVAAITPLKVKKTAETANFHLMELDYYRLAIYVVLFIIGASGYFLDGRITALVFAVPAGLFGLEVVPEIDRRRAIYFSIFAMVSDIVFELFVINLAGYNYAGGFSLDVPFEYFLLALSGFGLASLTYNRILPRILRVSTVKG